MTFGVFRAKLLGMGLKNGSRWSGSDTLIDVWRAEGAGRAAEHRKAVGEAMFKPNVECVLESRWCSAAHLALE
jgi:hypothetical protein